MILRARITFLYNKLLKHADTQFNPLEIVAYLLRDSCILPSSPGVDEVVGHDDMVAGLEEEEDGVASDICMYHRDGANGIRQARDDGGTAFNVVAAGLRVKWLGSSSYGATGSAF